MSTLFVSDLHLQAERPALTRAFLSFLGNQHGQIEALYILGDLFEAWLGDDDQSEPGMSVISALQQLKASGTECFVMHGNRDFLLGQAFCASAGCELLPDPAVIDLYGKRVLLMHGDSLCTEDHDYLAFRHQVRDPIWQQQFLAQPLAQRQAIARQLREQSMAANASKNADIMDVTESEVLASFARHQVDLLIHGHTHRPQVHHYRENGQSLTRIVLGDWDRTGWALQYGADHHFELQQFTLAATGSE